MQPTDPHSTSARGLSGVAPVPGAPQLRSLKLRCHASIRWSERTIVGPSSDQTISCRAAPSPPPPHPSPVCVCVYVCGQEALTRCSLALSSLALKGCGARICRRAEQADLFMSPDHSDLDSSSNSCPARSLVREAELNLAAC